MAYLSGCLTLGDYGCYEWSVTYLTRKQEKPHMTHPTGLTIEREFMSRNLSRLRQEYPGKVLLIKGTKIHGAYDTPEEGILAGTEKFPTASEFLVRSVDQEGDVEIHIPALAAGIALSY